jgi:hypothetical protein
MAAKPNATAHRKPAAEMNEDFVPIQFVDKRSVGETPTGATETVALPEKQKLSVNRIGTEDLSFNTVAILSGLARKIQLLAVATVSWMRL